jgi:predicted ATPase
MNNLFVITGGPGAGKTAILEALHQQGYHIVPEAGRSIIRQQVEISGSALPWGDQQEYARLMFLQAQSDYELWSRVDQPVFLDRGIPDVIGYLQLCGWPVPELMSRHALDLRYNNKVFVAPPWKEIYRNDEERKQSFEEAVKTFDVMMRVYNDLGYTTVELPKVSVEERVVFIVGHLN